MTTATLTTSTLDGKPYAGNPHVRFDEGEVASTKPRRGALLYSKVMGRRISPFAAALFSFVFSLSAHAAAPTLLSPANGATFALLNNINTTNVKLYNFEIGRKYSWTVK